MTPTRAAQIVPDDLKSLNLTPPGWGWRASQQELAERIAQSEKKIIMLEAECGTGKSIIPIAAATAAKKTAVVLIQTIQLQAQYLNDIKGLAMMTGRSHSTCNLTQGPASEAPCTVGARCTLRGQWTRQGAPLSVPECHYFKRKAVAALAPISIQNYAYWLGETQGETSAFGARDWIICDEGHELDQILMSAAIVELRADDLLQAKIPLKDHFASLKALRDHIDAEGMKRLKKYDDAIRLKAKELGLEFDEKGGIDLSTETFGANARALQLIVRGLQITQRLYDSFSTIRGLTDDQLDEWRICPPDRNNREWTVRPLFGKYGFQRILNGAKEKVIIMSAYLAPPLLMENLGLNPDDVEVIEAPKVFNRVRSPILYCPVIKVKYGMTVNQKKYLYAMMDAIINHYGDSKGLIHVPSVAMRDEIMLATRNRARIMAYDGSNVHQARYPEKEQVIDAFVKTPLPKILLGQSISTGLDLPDVPQWQIIMKLSFPPTNDPVISARMEKDKAFYRYHTICQLVQAVGRVKRSVAHNGPTIIIDEQFSWFYAANARYFPKWFRDALRKDNGWEYLPEVKAARSKIALSCGLSL